MNYQEVIEDDNSFFAKIDPILRSGQYSGYDLMVITDGFEFTDLVELREVIPLDHGMLPNFTKYALRKFMQESLRPGQRVQRAVGVGHHRHRVEHQVRQGAGHQHQRPVEPRSTRARSA